MKKNEMFFYLVIAIGTGVVELFNVNGYGSCVFLPVMLIILYVGLKVFPKKEKSSD